MRKKTNQKPIVEFPMGDFDDDLLDEIWKEIAEEEKAKTTIAKALFSGAISISKAKGDLVKKVIVDKNGHRKTVWVKPGEGVEKKKKKESFESALVQENVSIGNSHGRVLAQLEEDSFLVVDYESGELGIYSEKDLTPSKLTESQIIEYFNDRVSPKITEEPELYEQILKEFPNLKDITDIMAMSGVLSFMHLPDLPTVEISFKEREFQGKRLKRVSAVMGRDDEDTTKDDFLSDRGIRELEGSGKGQIFEITGLFIPEKFQGKGLGTQSAYDALQFAKKFGIKKTELEAYRSDDTGLPQNGYYTWARLGYEINKKLNEDWGFQENWEWVVNKIKKDHPEVDINYKTTFKEIFEKGYGELWKEYGTTFHAQMLNQNKKQTRVLEEYYKRKNGAALLKKLKHKK